MKHGRDEEQFQDLLNDHKGIILRVARSFSEDNADRDDLCQEILLRIWSAMPSYQGEAKLSTWIYRVALNRALTWSRDESRRKKRQVPLIAVADAQADADDDKQRLLAELYAAIRNLNEIDRSLILMTLDNFSYKEIAEVMGMTVSNVGVRLNRAKKRLSEAMAKRSNGL